MTLRQDIKTGNNIHHLQWLGSAIIGISQCISNVVDDLAKHQINPPRRHKCHPIYLARQQARLKQILDARKRCRFCCGKCALKKRPTATILDIVMTITNGQVISSTAILATTLFVVAWEKSVFFRSLMGENVYYGKRFFRWWWQLKEKNLWILFQQGGGRKRRTASLQKVVLRQPPTASNLWPRKALAYDIQRELHVTIWGRRANNLCFTWICFSLTIFVSKLFGECEGWGCHDKPTRWVLKAPKTFARDSSSLTSFYWHHTAMSKNQRELCALANSWVCAIPSVCRPYPWQPTDRRL